MMWYNNYCAMCTDSNETVMQSQPCGCGGMADTLDLGSSAERREGSNPFIRTMELWCNGQHRRLLIC